jgi:leucine efflux protein
MQSIQNPGGFIVAILLFQMIPGPGTLNILRATARHGMRAGCAAMAGTLLGGFCCMAAAASGLEAIFRGQPDALRLLQVAGSLYLAWMGWRLVAKERAGTGGAAAEPAPSLARHLRQSFAVSLTNPKVLLFYFALLPLFLRAPVTPSSFAVLVLCVTGTSFVWQTALVLGGNAAARRLARLPGAGLVAQRLAGVLLVGCAIKVLVG